MKKKEGGRMWLDEDYLYRGCGTELLSDVQEERYARGAVQSVSYGRERPRV